MDRGGIEPSLVEACKNRAEPSLGLVLENQCKEGSWLGSGRLVARSNGSTSRPPTPENIPSPCVSLSSLDSSQRQSDPESPIRRQRNHPVVLLVTPRRSPPRSAADAGCLLQSSTFPSSQCSAAAPSTPRPSRVRVSGSAHQAAPGRQPSGRRTGLKPPRRLAPPHQRLQLICGPDEKLDSIQLWWARKELAMDKKLSDYIGTNDKTKIVIRLSLPMSLECAPTRC